MAGLESKYAVAELGGSWLLSLECNDPVGVYGGVKTTESSTEDGIERADKDLPCVREAVGVRLIGDDGEFE